MGRNDAVLIENKRQDCAVIPYALPVTHKDCETKFVINNRCYGSCPSSSAPEILTRTVRNVCKMCWFDKAYNDTVILNCPKRKKNKAKKVIKVLSCKCREMDICRQKVNKTW